MFSKDFDYLSNYASSLVYPNPYPPVNYPNFEARWRPASNAERANYGLFLTDLCDLLGVPRPDATTGPTAVAAADTTAALPWPAELAQQMQAMRAVVAQAATPALLRCSHYSLPSRHFRCYVT